MAVIKVTDIAYVRLRSAGHSTSRRSFSDNFGWFRATRAARRSTIAAPIRCITSTSPRRGDPKFLAIAYHAASEDDLKTLRQGARRLRHREPGRAGRRQARRLTEPNGYQIEVVWGMEKVPTLPAPRQVLNSGYAPLARKGDLMRIQKGPSRSSASPMPCSARRR
jgi:hypothetical protein